MTASSPAPAPESANPPAKSRARSAPAKPRVNTPLAKPRKPAGKATAKKPAAAPPKVAKLPKARDAAKHGKPAAPKLKPKLVRDSFTMPKAEYAVLGGLKERALSLARHVKKSELLRAGIVALNAMSDKAFLEALEQVPSLKTGRPSQQAGAAAKPV